jgi:hypothetical protein
VISTPPPILIFPPISAPPEIFKALVVVSVISTGFANVVLLESTVTLL